MVAHVAVNRIAIGALALSASAFVGIAVHEAYRPTAYLPTPNDVPTIGFGTTEGVKLGDKITVERALVRLLADTQKHQQAMVACLPGVELHQHEFDAFASLAYNIGTGAFCRSTLANRLRSGDYEAACREILKWDYAGGKRLAGLTKRRQAEYQQCMGVNHG